MCWSWCFYRLYLTLSPIPSSQYRCTLIIRLENIKAWLVLNLLCECASCEFRRGRHLRAVLSVRAPLTQIGNATKENAHIESLLNPGRSSGVTRSYFFFVSNRPSYRTYFLLLYTLLCLLYGTTSLRPVQRVKGNIEKTKDRSANM